MVARVIRWGGPVVVVVVVARRTSTVARAITPAATQDGSAPRGGHVFHIQRTRRRTRASQTYEHRTNAFALRRQYGHLVF
jgi:hypothetical protein